MPSLIKTHPFSLIWQSAKKFLDSELRYSSHQMQHDVLAAVFIETAAYHAVIPDERFVKAQDHVD